MKLLWSFFLHSTPTILKKSAVLCWILYCMLNISFLGHVMSKWNWLWSSLTYDVSNDIYFVALTLGEASPLLSNQNSLLAYNEIGKYPLICWLCLRIIILCARCNCNLATCRTWNSLSNDVRVKGVLKTGHLPTEVLHNVYECSTLRRIKKRNCIWRSVMMWGWMIRTWSAFLWWQKTGTWFQVCFPSLYVLYCVHTYPFPLIPCNDLFLLIHKGGAYHDLAKAFSDLPSLDAAKKSVRELRQRWNITSTSNGTFGVEQSLHEGLHRVRHLHQSASEDAPFR